MIAGVRALSEHFERQMINASVEVVGIDYRVRYALPTSLPLVSLIIPTRNSLNLIKQCVESVLAKTTYSNYEIIIIDNGSDDSDTLSYFQELIAKPNIQVFRDDGPFNYSALNNAAVKIAKGEIICLLNNDIEVISPDWLSEMVSHALRPEVGAVGAKLYYPKETIQHAGVILGISRIAGHAHKDFPRKNQGYIRRANLIQSFSAVTAACLVIRKSIFESLGGLNETDLTVSFNDIDFCIRVREAGYRNIWTPYAELYHHESATRGYEDTPEKQARFGKESIYLRQRWGDLLLNDPAYSPNLTLDHEDFSLAWPPRLKDKNFKNEKKLSEFSSLKKSKHYLFLTYRMALGYGVDVVVSNVVKNLINMGYQITIGCFDKDDYYNDMDIRLLGTDPKNTTHLIEVISNLVEDIGIECVIAHTWPFFEILPNLNLKVPTWAWEHGDPSPDFFPEEVAERQGIKERKLQNSYPAITGVIAISDFIRSDIQWPNAKIIYNGCDHVPDLGSKSIFDYNLNPAAKLKVGTLMRLGQGESLYKGNQHFLEIAKRCQAQNIPAQFYVMGRGTPEDAAYFQSIGIETYLNAPDEQKWEYLRKLDLFFSPSLWEGCNLPLLEAQASGTMSFAFDTGAHPEMSPFIISSMDEAVALIKQISSDRNLLLKNSLLSYHFVRNKFYWKESAINFLQITL
jgi:GT2 family glycosyltransferase